MKISETYKTVGMTNSHVTEVRTAVAAFLAAHLATAVRRVEAAPLRVLHAPAVAAVLRRHCLAHVLTRRAPPAAAACGRERDRWHTCGWCNDT